MADPGIYARPHPDNPGQTLVYCVDEDGTVWHLAPHRSRHPLPPDCVRLRAIEPLPERDHDDD